MKKMRMKQKGILFLVFLILRLKLVESCREDPFMEVDVQNEKENFYGAMDAYEKKRNPKAEAKTRIASWSWEEVLVDLNKAKVVYKEKGKIRRLLDKLKKSIPTLRSWLQLLPDGDYGSIICGAFKLILDVNLLVG